MSEIPFPFSRFEAASHRDFGIDDIVTQLRAIRDESLQRRRRIGRSAKLPSQKALRTIVENLTGAFFPNRLGARSLTPDGVDYFVGHLLDLSVRELAQQLELERRFTWEADDVVSNKSAGDAAAFAAELPSVRALLESDLQAAYLADPAAGTIDEVLACYPGIKAAIYYRIGHVLYRLGYSLTARMISELAHSQTGIDIHPGAVIGDSFFIDHGTGVVIGETAVIGNRVRLHHGVTLGARATAGMSHSAEPFERLRHPVVEDDVVIYSGATLLGRITIGRNSVIGGNVWLTRDVPPGSRIEQAEIRREEFDSGSGI